MEEKKIRVLKWQDAVSFGLAALVATVLVLIAQLNGLNDHVSTWRWLGIWLVPVVGWAVYGRLIHLRWLARKAQEERLKQNLEE